MRRQHHPDCADGGCSGGAGSGPADAHDSIPGGRLNLLLSWGGWRPDSWADRMACLLEPMGVQSLRAQSARQAEKVIRTSVVHIAVVDLGLPLELGIGNAAPGWEPGDEAGARVLDLLQRLENPPPTVIVKSPRSSRDAVRDMSAALRFDAFAVVDRASADVELMLKVLQRAMDRYYSGRWPAPPTMQ